MRRLAFVVLVLSLMFAAFPVAAQGDTLVITEAEINQTFLIKANPSLQIANVVVDLRPGKLAISATLIPKAGDTIEGKIVLVPSLDRGYLSWVVVEVLLDGEEAPDAVVSQINTALLPAWRTFAASRIIRSVKSVEITDNEMTITFAEAGMIVITPEATPTAQPGKNTTVYIFTEAQANDTIDLLSAFSIRITNEVVDFQPGQVVISATLVPRRGDTIQVIATLVPETTTKAITWTLTKLLIGGQPAPDATVKLVNESLTARWSRYIRQQTTSGGAESLEITDDQMIFVLETANK